MNPSSWIDAFKEVVDAVAAGGTRSIIMILLGNLLLILGGGYTLVKFLIRYSKEHNDTKDKLLRDKDEIIYARTARLEQLTQQTNENAQKTIERLGTLSQALSNIHHALLYRRQEGPTPPPLLIASEDE